MKTLLLLLLLLAGCSRPDDAGSRAVKFYQSPMHPWITSDQPGQCTICGMDLVPVYEGEEGISTRPGLVTLQPSTAQILGVATGPAVKAPLERTLRLSGVIEDDDAKHRVISAFFDGRIDRVYVEHVGEEVVREQPLATIYSPELLYIVREFQASSARGRNDPQATVARQRLIQFGLTPQQVDELAAGPRESYGLALRSPMDGTIITRNAYPGKYVKAGEMLFEIADFGVMWFHARVYEQDLPWIKIGDKAVLTTPAAPGREFEGTITLVDPSFDPVTRSTRVRIEVPNPKVEGAGGLARALPHRAYAEARIRATEGEAVLVPRSALLDTGARAVVYVDRGGGAYEKRDVKAGRRGDTDVEIVSGLTAGESVVVQGNLMIDAEAQMAQPQALGVDAGAETAHRHPVPPDTLERWKVLSDAAAALAADNLEAFNRTSVAGQPVASLADARRAYYEAVTPAIEEALRHPGQVKVYECPMAGGAFPGSPDKARWLQMEPPLRNPWFGPTMSECGEEVTP